MPLWGIKDTVYSTGKVNVTTAGVVTKHSGAGLDFTASCKVGMVVTLADDGAGQGVIKSIDSATQLTLTNLDLPGAFTNVDYEIRETPVAEVKGGSFAVNQVFGVSVAEQQETVDDNSQYHPAHSGWVGISTHMDMHGNLRVKTETLVALNITSADQSDDTIDAAGGFLDS